MLLCFGLLIFQRTPITPTSQDPLQEHNNDLLPSGIETEARKMLRQMSSLQMFGIGPAGKFYSSVDCRMRFLRAKSQWSRYIRVRQSLLNF